jgi:hypothetical protein
VRIDHTDLGAQAIEHRLGKRPGQFEFSFGELALGDVDHIRQSHRAAANSRLDANRVADDGLGAAVTTDDLEFAAGFIAAAQEGLVSLEGALAIFRRKDHRERPADQFALGVAVEIAVGRIDIAIKAIDVDDRDTDRRLLDDLVEKPGQIRLDGVGGVLGRYRVRFGPKVGMLSRRHSPHPFTLHQLDRLSCLFNRRVAATGRR